MLSLDPEDYAWLKREANRQRTRPATLAARFIAERREQSPDQVRASRPFRALVDWLARRIDRVREQGDWPRDITVSFFEQIEREAPELYAEAKAELGQQTLNQSIGRIVRTRLGAEVVSRSGRPALTRVPQRRTTLIKTYTPLQPVQDETNDE